jgi:hypothetical protein
MTDRPDLRLDVDRIMASELGLTQQDVAGSVLVSLSSTSQVSPNFWSTRELRQLSRLCKRRRTASTPWTPC